MYFRPNLTKPQIYFLFLQCYRESIILNPPYMYHHFNIYSDFDRQTDYDPIFGQYIGNIFAKTMEECFYLNPLQEDEDYYYGVALDDIMSLPQYLTAVSSTYTFAIGEHPKSDMSSMFKLNSARFKKYGDNDVREEFVDNKRCFAYRNIKSEVAQAIIFGAYFLACINTEIWPEIKPTREFLLEYLRECSCLNDEAFKSKHIANALYDRYFIPTMHKIAQAMADDGNEESTSGSHDLQYYIDHPVYGLGYDSVLSYLSVVSMKDNVELAETDYVNVFAEAEECVNRVLNANKPELEIPRIHAYINKKYFNSETKGNGLKITVITSQYCVGCIIEMLFMIALYDLLPEKTDRVMKTLINMRAFIENHENDYIYKNDELWTLIAQRIPPLPGRPRLEDLQVEIERLKSGQSGVVSDKSTAKLDAEILKLKKEIDGYKEIIHPDIPEKYLQSVESVFLPTYRWCDEEFPVNLIVRETGKKLLDPNEPTLVPIFIKACIAMKCARDCSLKFPKKIVDALIGLGALPLPGDDLKKFSDNVGRKIRRLEETEMTDEETRYYESVVTSLSKPYTE